MAFSFSDKIVNPSDKTTLIVDALNLAFRWKHQGRTDFRYDYQRTVESLAKSYDCKRLIIAADWGSSSYRKGINPEYKQNRKEKFAEQTEEERIAFEEFFEENRELFQMCVKIGDRLCTHAGISETFVKDTGYWSHDYEDYSGIEEFINDLFHFRPNQFTFEGYYDRHYGLASPNGYGDDELSKEVQDSA